MSHGCVNQLKLSYIRGQKTIKYMTSFSLKEIQWFEVKIKCTEEVEGSKSDLRKVYSTRRENTWCLDFGEKGLTI